MSTGPEHYRVAEAFIDGANEAYLDDDLNEAAMKLQFAQVHATLALAAATAQEITYSHVAGRTWRDVLQP